jgi:hypothetical protein
MLDAKFYGRRPVGKPRLRWEENVRRDSSLPLNVRWRLAGDRDIWKRTINLLKPMVK